MTALRNKCYSGNHREEEDDRGTHGKISGERNVDSGLEVRL